MDLPLTRILIVDDFPVVRSGVHRYIEHEPGLAVCGEAASGHDAVRMARQLQPDIVLLDPDMFDLGGVEILHHMGRDCPETMILVFSLPVSACAISALILAGARGYVLKSDAPEIAISAIRAITSGRPFFSPALADADLQTCLHLVACNAGGAAAEAMTPRELQVLRHLADGIGNKDLAQLLGISVKTVETHRATIMRKIGARSAVDMVRYAIRHNLSHL
ncbi:hypothetical protein VW29_02755 [Devosia limi DSM 17137]|uniref:Two component transcriptional regulator, LuxR family n=1 Tax=Devosia limi DSM 17137 TaxID=1121477 RepID=A0A0F5LVU1_9HYPH|nr:response regulator transcription factor [Devosia limi]KKB86490.1 hypothetical protein VW29_02755 [Devosia limi DSM 17137]SHE86907.1 two component transcriptional regulator, LuxR family [Devosia limi DSM 17137]